MTVALQTAPKKKASPARELHSAPDLAYFSLKSHFGLIGLCLITLILKSLIFEPIGWWPLSFVCLVPWILGVVGSTQAPRVYVYSYLWAAAFFLFNMRWMIPATGLGYVALALYLAVYFPLMACPIRHAVRRRNWPLAVVVPLVWVGCEALRAVVVSGFPWFYLSHSVHRVLPLIQISDVVGAYGVSFLAASGNGLLAAWLLMRMQTRSAFAHGEWEKNAPNKSPSPLPSPQGGEGAIPGQLFRTIPPVDAVVFVSLLVGFVGYGIVQLTRNTSEVGPKVAVLQGDFLSTVDPDSLPEHEQFAEPEKMAVYLDMILDAGKQQPDLFLLPESPWQMFLNAEERDYRRLSRESYAYLQQFAQEFQAHIVTGSATKFRTPHDLLAKVRIRNSASIFYPDGRDLDRYDKVHLVPFGEYIPFRFGKLRFLYFWLGSMMPFEGPDGADEFSMFPGEAFHTYSMTATSNGKSYQFGIPICYEDVMPYVAREFVYGGKNTKRSDFLLNISNDGWFGRGVQQPQHLAISTFRAVENRVGIARAVNTGGSAFIDPSGKIHDVVQGDQGKRWPGKAGYAVANVMVDSRFTLYSRYGDWFAWLCAVGWLLIYVDYWRHRAQKREAVEGQGTTE